MRIFINVFRGKTYAIDVELSYTVEMIKNKIQDLAKIPIAQQRLFYEDMELKTNYYALNDYHFLESNFTILLKSERSIIFIKLFNGKTFPIEVKLSDTLKKLKMKIQNLENIPYSQQRLFFEGFRLEDIQLKDDNLSLIDYKIHEESTLLLSLKLKEPIIFVRTLTGKLLFLEIEPSMIIYTI